MRHWQATIQGAASVAATFVLLAGCDPGPANRADVNPVVNGIRSAQQTQSQSETSEVTVDKIARDIVGKVVRVSQSSGMGGSTMTNFAAS